MVSQKMYGFYWATLYISLLTPTTCLELLHDSEMRDVKSATWLEAQRPQQYITKSQLYIGTTA